MSKKEQVNIPETESVETPIVEEEIKSQLPEPKGWKILIAMPRVDEKTDGGIIKATTTLRDEEVSNICGYVLKLGTECYNDSKRFPSGPWCKEGDWVVFRAYSGRLDAGSYVLNNRSGNKERISRIYQMKRDCNFQ